MQKIMLAACAAALFSMTAFAEDSPGLKTGEAPPPPHKMTDGYRGIEDARTMNIKHVKEMHDGASVTLRGNLLKKKGNDTYDFRDKTGQIEVVIPVAVFEGKTVSPEDLVGISGSLDKKQQPPRIMVHHFQRE